MEASLRVCPVAGPQVVTRRSDGPTQRDGGHDGGLRGQGVPGARDRRVAPGERRRRPDRPGPEVVRPVAPEGDVRDVPTIEEAPPEPSARGPAGRLYGHGEDEDVPVALEDGRVREGPPLDVPPENPGNGETVVGVLEFLRRLFTAGCDEVCPEEAGLLALAGPPVLRRGGSGPSHS